MPSELLALFLAVGVPLAIRLIDYLLPKGRRFTILDRFTVEVEDDEDEDDDGDPIEVG